jgi:hypothetical protein
MDGVTYVDCPPGRHGSWMGAEVLWMDEETEDGGLGLGVGPPLFPSFCGILRCKAAFDMPLVEGGVALRDRPVRCALGTHAVRRMNQREREMDLQSLGLQPRLMLGLLPHTAKRAHREIDPRPRGARRGRHGHTPAANGELHVSRDATACPPHSRERPRAHLQAVGPPAAGGRTAWATAGSEA